MNRKQPAISPFARQILHPFIGRCKPGSAGTITRANLLVRLARGYRLVYAASMKLPRGRARGYQKRPPAWRFIHETLGQTHSRQGRVGEPILTQVQKKGWVVRSSDGGWEITDLGKQAADAMVLAGLCSKSVLEAHPGTRVVDGVRIPDPFVQPECPQHHPPTKGTWSKGWIAAWMGQPRQYPGKRKSIVWYQGYDLAHARKFGTCR